MGRLLVLGIKEGMVECATVCAKSWVILTQEAKKKKEKKDWTMTIWRATAASHNVMFLS